MKHIDISSKDGRFIKISDDETYVITQNRQMNM